MRGGFYGGYGGGPGMGRFGGGMGGPGGMRFGQRNRNQGGFNPMVMFVLMRMWQQYEQMEHKPPGTLALIVANALVYFQGSLTGSFAGAGISACLNPQAVLEGFDLKGLLVSPFVHGNEYHLAMNMSSLLYKGYMLESRMGTEAFLKLAAGLLLGTNLLACVAAYALLVCGIDAGTYYTMCPQGFSGVLFAMKVVLNANSEGRSSVFGVHVPTKHLAWAELLIVQMMYPGSGGLYYHVCGMAAGYAYLRREMLLRRMRPLLDLLASLLLPPQGPGGPGAGAPPPHQHQQPPPRQHQPPPPRQHQEAAPQAPRAARPTPGPGPTPRPRPAPAGGGAERYDPRGASGYDPRDAAAAGAAPRGTGAQDDHRDSAASQAAARAAAARAAEARAAPRR